MDVKFAMFFFGHGHVHTHTCNDDDALTANVPWYYRSAIWNFPPNKSVCLAEKYGGRGNKDTLHNFMDHVEEKHPTAEGEEDIEEEEVKDAELEEEGNDKKPYSKVFFDAYSSFLKLRINPL